MPGKIRILHSVVEIDAELSAGGLLPALYRHLASSDPATARLAVKRHGRRDVTVLLEKEVSQQRVLAPGAEPVAEAHRILLEGTLGEARECWVLHAGAVCGGDRALLILGASWAGKTTLVEALLGRGFALLSDDYAPVRASDGFVVPFPRALGRRAPSTDPLAPPLLARQWIDPAGLAALAPDPVPVAAIAVLEECGRGARPSPGFRPLSAAETLGHLLSALRNPATAPDPAAGLAALAIRTPAAALARGPLDEMASAAAALLG